jgi:small subunit ribosomal protein S4
MGDPRRLRKIYKSPKKLFDRFRIREEKKLKNEYGLKNMRSLWVARSELRKIRRDARKSLALSEEKRKGVLEKITKKLAKYNILPENASIDDILSLDVKSILERRLQTLVYRKGMAKTIDQARQLITHGFISIGDRRIKSPGYLVKANEENNIRYFKDPSRIFKETGKGEEEGERAERGKEEKAKEKGLEEGENG